MQIAERIRTTVALPRFEIAAVTVSTGVAWASPQNESVESPVDRADQAVYAAKRLGRNRIHAYGDG